MILIINKKNEIKVFEHLEKRKIKFYNIGYVENKENRSKDVIIRKFGGMAFNIGILISGNGSNMLNIIKASKSRK